MPLGLTWPDCPFSEVLSIIGLLTVFPGTVGPFFTFIELVVACLGALGGFVFFKSGFRYFGSVGI